LKDAVALAESSGFDAWDSSGDSTRQFISHGIAKHFEVSDQVIEKRLIRENLWPPIVKGENNNRCLPGDTLEDL
jgi:hypothetical protein